MKVFVTNTTKGMKGIGKLRFPPGTSVVSEEQFRPIAKHPALERGDLKVSQRPPAGADVQPVIAVATPPVLPSSWGVRPLPETDDERFAREVAELEEGERKKAAGNVQP